MPETPDDPLDPPAPIDPLDAPLAASPLPADPLSVVSPALPFAPPVPDEASSPSVPPPASLIPASVRERAAEDLPFALSPGGFVSGSSSRSLSDDDTEGIPTGLPDLRSLAGVEEEPQEERLPEAQWESRPPASKPVLPEGFDDGELMALPSPSMIEPSPFAEADEPSEDSEPDEVVSGLRPLPGTGASIYEDETEQEQLPPTPIGMMRREGPDSVPARVMLEALEASERRHIVHLAIAFTLGAASSVGGFVAARWALTNL